MGQEKNVSKSSYLVICWSLVICFLLIGPSPPFSTILTIVNELTSDLKIASLCLLDMIKSNIF